LSTLRLRDLSLRTVDFRTLLHRSVEAGNCLQAVASWTVDLVAASGWLEEQKLAAR